jgi:hypothetical protein
MCMIPTVCRSSSCNSSIERQTSIPGARLTPYMSVVTLAAYPADQANALGRVCGASREK